MILQICIQDICGSFVYLTISKGNLGPKTVGRENPALQAFSGWGSGPVDHNHCFKEQDFLEVKSAEHQAGHTVFREVFMQPFQTAIVRKSSHYSDLKSHKHESQAPLKTNENRPA